MENTRSITAPSEREAADGSAATRRATIGSTWIQAGALLVTLLSMIIGGVMLAEVRAARAEWQSTAQERQGNDHEQRIRAIESTLARLEGKVDAISTAVGADRSSSGK